MRSVLGSVGSRRHSTTPTVLLNASAFGLQGYVDHTLPLSLLCITMILRVRRNFFEITTKPNNLLSYPPVAAGSLRKIRDIKASF